MTDRERTLAILNYQKADKMPVVHFGYWGETLAKWHEEGHITKEDAVHWGNEIEKKLGFDFEWNPSGGTGSGMNPVFKEHLIEKREDGSYLWFDGYGVTLLKKEGNVSIPAEVAHSLVDRASWERDFKHRFQFFKERVPDFSWIKDTHTDKPRGLHLGSLFGDLRNIIGVVNISYMYADDEELYKEIIDTNADLIYKCTEKALSQGVKFDYAHFWEDICFKNGPLISPAVFEEFVAPHYKRITNLCNSHGINIISLDCDGMIDALVPIWLENGVNTMFPIEVGTWEASIKPWREKYGKKLLGIGGMDKRVFAQDYAAVDKEIERLKELIELGGYIPCPDHRIAPDAIWENVQYYCEKMQGLKI